VQALRRSRGLERAGVVVSIQAADSSQYAAILTGNAGKVAMKLGYGAWSPGAGWTLAASGTHCAIRTQESR
jgi:alpha-amylase